MKRFTLYALAFFIALLFGGAHAGEGAESTPAASKVECKKKMNGKCKPIKEAVRHKTKQKPKPLAKVTPRIPKTYTPPRGAKKKLAEIIAVYKSCMYGEGDRVTRALERNFSGEGYLLGNEVCLADAIGLKRYETLPDIESAKQSGELVEVSASPGLVIADDLPDVRHYARPWVREYLVALARDMEAHFAKEGGSDFTPLRVSSLVRSYKDQRRQKNSPASCWTEICSTHTTGSAVDVSNNPFRMGKKEREWLRERLVLDRKNGKIVIVEEWFPPHFHIFVLPPEFVPGKSTEGKNAE